MALVASVMGEEEFWEHQRPDELSMSSQRQEGKVFRASRAWWIASEEKSEFGPLSPAESQHGIAVIVIKEVWSDKLIFLRSWAWSWKGAAAASPAGKWIRAMKRPC